MKLQYLTALVTAGAAGCLAVPDGGQTPMCESNADCDTANGEICADGVCWGDPPPGIYAMRIGPPATREDLVPTEITKVDIAQSGWFTTQLRLEEPVTITGSVTLDCADAPPCPAIASTITISRPARIPGGPPFVTVAHTTEDSADFQIEVPRAEPDEDYSVIITPDRAHAYQIALDDVAPARVIVHPTEDLTGLDVTLGGQSRSVTGVVLDTNGDALPGARVVVRGQWEAGSPTTDISSVSTTDSMGAFTVYLPESTIDTAAQIEVTPEPDPNVLRPTLLATLDLAVGGQVVTVPVLEMPNLGATRDLTLPIMGTSETGLVEPVVDADVTIAAELEIPQLPYAPIVAQIVVSAKTDMDGLAHLQALVAPALSYELHVKPPSQSGAAQLATVYGMPIEVGGGGRLSSIHLANQVSVRGALYDHDGRPAEGVVVTVLPNAAYAATLSDTLQRKLAEVVATSETTDANGDFAVYVDPEIDGLAAQYDVMFEAPQHSLLPSWQKQGITVDRADGLDLQDIDLPEAAYVRGPVVDPNDQPIEGAEVRLYEIPSSILPCAGVVAAEDPACAQKAILRALGQSDVGGDVHLVLPDP